MFNGHASSSTGMTRTISEWRASVESARPVIEMRCAPILRMDGSKAMSSSLSPDLPIAMIMSSLRAMPMSPCMPSVGWRNRAGMPVDTMVEAIFCAIIPDLPMPVRITLPGQAYSKWTASS